MGVGSFRHPLADRQLLSIAFRVGHRGSRNPALETRASGKILGDAPVARRIGAEDGVHDFLPTCSDEAGDPEYLTGSNLEVVFFEVAPAGQSKGQEYDVSWRKEPGKRTADLQFAELAGAVDLTKRQAGNFLVTAKHGQMVGNVVNLVRTVRHEQDRVPLVAQLPHHAKKRFCLVVGKRRRRIVREDDWRSIDRAGARIWKMFPERFSINVEFPASFSLTRARTSSGLNSKLTPERAFAPGVLW